MKFEMNPLDVKPRLEMTFYGDARPKETIGDGDIVSISGSDLLYRITDVLINHDSTVYGLEPLRPDDHRA